MAGRNFLFTSESVTEGHPDKVCDQVSDGVLDEVLKQDIRGRVACESFVTVGLTIVGGEITTSAYVDIRSLVRDIVKNIGYTGPKFGYAYNSSAILNAIGSQSPDIAQGYLGPDGKSQVTVEYRDGKPERVDAVVLSTQHTEEILDRTGDKITEKSRQEIIDNVIKPIVPSGMLDEKTKYYINPTGKFIIGGPQSDTGMTGRKIIVDTYGGMATHGGGAFSGKDPSKVDRSAAYMCRYIAKNIVAAELTEKCTIQLAYAIGVAEPVSIMIFTDGPAKVSPDRLVEIVKKNFELTPKGIIDSLDLLRPIYLKTAAYGHFGREIPEFTWEKTDRVRDLLKDV